LAAGRRSHTGQRRGGGARYGCTRRRRFIWRRGDARCEIDCIDQGVPGASEGDRMKTEERLKELGIELPEPRAPIANFVNAVRTGNLMFLAGNGPGLPGRPLPQGKVGRDFSIEQAYRLARDV